MIVLLVLGNLRGARAAGAPFAVPTYMFIMAIALIVVVGLVKSGSHGFHAMAPAPHPATEALGLLLILRAFASGATAMTGIEVISNAVPVFQPPEADNARKTLSGMIVLLVAMFAGVLVIAHLDGASPGDPDRALADRARHRRQRPALRVRAALHDAGAADRRELRGQRVPTVACTSWPATGTSRGCSCTWATASRSPRESSCSRSLRRSSTPSSTDRPSR